MPPFYEIFKSHRRQGFHALTTTLLLALFSTVLLKEPARFFLFLPLFDLPPQICCVQLSPFSMSLVSLALQGRPLLGVPFLGGNRVPVSPAPRRTVSFFPLACHLCVRLVCDAFCYAAFIDPSPSSSIFFSAKESALLGIAYRFPSPPAPYLPS